MPTFVFKSVPVEDDFELFNCSFSQAIRLRRVGHYEYLPEAVQFGRGSHPLVNEGGSVIANDYERVPKECKHMVT